MRGGQASDEAAGDPGPWRQQAILAKQTVQQLPGRRRAPFLREQRTHPRFHIPQR
jgi:hypothetical protein